MTNKNAVFTYSSNALMTFHPKSMDLAESFSRKIDEQVLKILEYSKNTDLSVPPGKSVTANGPSAECPPIIFCGPKISLAKLKKREKYSDFLIYFNLDEVRSHLLSKGHSVHDVDIDAFEKTHRLRHSLDLLMQLKLPKPSENVASQPFVCTRSHTLGLNDIEVTDRKYAAFCGYGCGFKLKFLTFDSGENYIHANSPSFYYLYLSLVEAVGGILRGKSNHENYDSGGDFVNLKHCCDHLDLFLGTANISKGFVFDILAHYHCMGYIRFSQFLEISKDKISSLKDLNKLFDDIEVSDPLRFAEIGRPKQHLGVSFCPSGFLLPYHVGVLSLLSELNLVNATTPLAGGSSGAITVVSASTLVPDLIELMRLVEIISADALVNGSRHRLDKIVRDSLSDHLKGDSHEDINARIGSVIVSCVTKRLIGYKSMFVSEFMDSTDLGNCLRASCNIPRFSTDGYDVIFRGKRAFDGQFATPIRDLGCPKTHATRTIMVTPFAVARRRVMRQELENEIINPILMLKDQYIIHYLALKMLLQKLWLRKLALEKKDKQSVWSQEVDLYVKAYYDIKSNLETSESWHRLFNLLGGIKSYEDIYNSAEIGIECDDGYASEPELANLFKLVVVSEISLEYKNSKVTSEDDREGELGDFDIMQKFARKKSTRIFSKHRFASTPHSLLDWLRYEYRMMLKDTNVGKNPENTELETLQMLLHCIMPPQSLYYCFTEFPFILQNSFDNFKKLKVALNSADIVDIRHLFDLGRSDAFRWLICEYISFENWLHLRIKQLRNKKTYRSVGEKLALRQNYGKNGSKLVENQNPESVHRQQTEWLQEFVGLLNEDHFQGLTDRITSNHSIKGGWDPRYKLFEMQSRLVRLAILMDIVDPHYIHILTHRHLWIYEK